LWVLQSSAYPSKLIIRDFLAKDRTEMANERTLLAYTRTAIMVLATGITLVKLFADDAFLVLIGHVLYPISLLLFILGVARFIKVKKELSVFYKQKSSS
jgi:putative membrane protein